MSSRQFSLVLIAIALIGAVCVEPAHAQLTPAQKCEKQKNIAAARRALCVARERGKQIAGRPSFFPGCATKMSEAFTRAETKAMGNCPTTGDAAAIDALVDDSFDPDGGIPKALAGARFVDNGDFTITDTVTGLMWEMKEALDGVPNPSNLHDADNTYTWSLSTPPSERPNGTVFTHFLWGLNACFSDGVTEFTGFAGHCDWRLPTVAELLSITDPNCANPNWGCIQPPFGPVRDNDYLSATSNAEEPDLAHTVYFFGDSQEDTVAKSDPNYARAVRRAR